MGGDQGPNGRGAGASAWQQVQRRVRGPRGRIMPLVAAALTVAATPTPALECRLDRLDGSGRTLDWSAYAGRYVYVDVWASWCAPCRQSFPFMNRVSERFDGQRLAVVAISVDRERSRAEEFLRANPARFTVVQDSEGRCARELQVKGMPSSYLIGPRGDVLHVHKGFRPDDADALMRVLQSWVDGSRQP